MGVTYNTNSLFRNNMLLHIDAANPKSYPGSGSIWKDISGNNNHITLYNNPTFGSDNFTLDGVNQYCRTTNKLNLTNYSFVVIDITFSKADAISPSGMLYEHTSNWNSVVGGFGMLPNSVGSTVYNASFSHSNHHSSPSANYLSENGTDITNHTIIWSSIAGIALRKYYVNGILVKSVDTSSSSFTDDYLYLGVRGGTTLHFRGSIYSIKIFSDTLTSNQVTQNFEAVRKRYKI